MEEKEEGERESNSNPDPEQQQNQLNDASSQPTHHPSAPLHELFDVQTTIDPSYIISLIRKLVPVDEGQDGDVHQLAGSNNSQNTETEEMVDNSSKENGGLNNSNGDIQTSETQPISPEQSSKPTESDNNGTEPCKKSAREEVWEESGCILWDLAANKDHAEFMVQNLVLEVLLANLITSESVRITELSLGIIGNLACHEALMNQIITTNKLLETVVDQIFSNDALCLCEVCRVLTLGLQGCQSIVWAKALQSEHNLSRMLWIAENTLNPTLIEKSVGLFLAIMENQQVVTILLPTLMKLGLSDLLVNLLGSEMGKLRSDRTPERYPALDSILRAVEALSVSDDFSDGICSNKEVVQMAVELIKVPEKIEISSSCVTAVVLIANILVVDAPDLALTLSEDFLLLQSLLDLFPFTSEEFEARNALWSVLAKLLFCVQKSELSTSRLGEFVSMLVNRSDMLEDALLDRELDKSLERDITATSEAKRSSRSAAIECVVKMLHQWNLVKDEISLLNNDASTDVGEKSNADDEDVQKLLECFLKHAG